MEKKGSEDVHYKYSKEELLTISKLELSLRKPEVLNDQCFNDNKRWSPELGFKAMLLESRHSNGNSITKVDIKMSDVKIDSNLPPLRPQLGGWGSGCIGMKPAAVTQTNSGREDLSPVRPLKRIIIPPRPQDPPSEPGWRGECRFPADPDRHSRRPPWNEKPYVSSGRPERQPERNRYPNRNGYSYREEPEDPDWDPPDLDTPFDFVGLPGDNRGVGEDHNSEDASPRNSPSSERPPSSGDIPRSESPDMETRMMSELLKIFDDSEVTEIPVVTNPGGSRILGLLSQQDQFQQSSSSYSDSISRMPPDCAIPNNSGQSHRLDDRFPFQNQLQPDGGAVGKDLLQILQKAKINVNSLTSNSLRGVNSLNAPSLKDIEEQIVPRDPRTGRSPPQPETTSENHAFNKLLEMMNSSKSRTDTNQQQTPQQYQHHQQPRLSSYELEMMHENKKRIEQEQQAMAEFRAKSDSIGSTGTPFVPIQVMRRGHFQEQQLPRPLVGRTSSISSNPGYPIQPGGNPFGPRMGLSDVEIRHLAQFRPAVGGGPRLNIGRNSPVNLLPQQQFMVPQLRGVNYAPGSMINPGQQHFGGPRPNQMPIGASGSPRGPLSSSNHHFQQRPLVQQQPTLPPSQSQGPMNLQQLQMLNQHLHSLPPHQLSEMSRGMTNEQLNQMLLRASHQ